MEIFAEFLIRDNLMNTDQYALSEKLLGEIYDVIRNTFSCTLGKYFYHRADLALRQLHYKEAIVLINESIKVYEQVAPESFELAYSLKHRSHIYHAVYQHERRNDEYLVEARKSLKHSGTIFEKLFEEVHLFPSEKYYQNICDQLFVTLDESERKLHSQMASQYYAEALNDFYSDKYSEAEKRAKLSLKIFTKLNGERDADPTAPMRVLAQVYSKQGRLTQAVELMEKVIHIREEIWGSANFRHFEYYETLADIYFANGKYPEGIKQLKMAIRLAGNQIIYQSYIQTLKERIEKYQNLID